MIHARYIPQKPGYLLSDLLDPCSLNERKNVYKKSAENNASLLLVKQDDIFSKLRAITSKDKNGLLDYVNSSSVDVCRDILERLHEDSSLSESLNSAGLKMVSKYSAYNDTRAKAKLIVLLELLFEQPSVEFEHTSETVVVALSTNCGKHPICNSEADFPSLISEDQGAAGEIITDAPYTQNITENEDKPVTPVVPADTEESLVEEKSNNDQIDLIAEKENTVDTALKTDRLLSRSEKLKDSGVAHSQSLSTANNTNQQKASLDTSSNLPDQEQEIATMAHNALPVTLQRLTQENWMCISSSVLSEFKKSTAFPDLEGIINNSFYHVIYEKASSDIKYTFNKADVSEAAEENRSSKWLDILANMPRKWGVYDDFSCTLSVKDQLNGLANVPKVPIYVDYHASAPIKARLQFVVLSEAGFPLLRKIFQVAKNYILNECQSVHERFPVVTYKVFSEDFQIGRSDSAVIYLSDSLDNEHVQGFVTKLNAAIGDKLAPLEIIGLTSVAGSHIQGINLPDANLQRKIISQATSSHGGLIANILSAAYARVKDTLGNSVANLSVEELNRHAQFHVKKIWCELGMDRIPVDLRDSLDSVTNQ